MSGVASLELQIILINLISLVSITYDSILYIEFKKMDIIYKNLKFFNIFYFLIKF